MRTCPIRLNDKPKVIKTVEKPIMNSRELSTTRRRSLGLACERLKSSNDTPAMKERYEGTSGNTQGDKNDSTPAPRATITESSTPCISYPHLLHRQDSGALGLVDVATFLELLGRAPKMPHIRLRDWRKIDQRVNGSKGLRGVP